ncbi:MAG: hypothetical protein ABIK89_23330 [Planctomycetota bacterium]
MTRRRRKRQATEEPIRAAQCRAIFAQAARLGLSLEDVRACTPAGSVSMLSCREAHELLNRLHGPGGSSEHFCGHGTATGAQLSLIAHLSKLAGFAESELAAWLERGWGVESIAEIDSRELARRIIGGLMRVHRARRQIPEPAGIPV